MPVVDTERVYGAMLGVAVGDALGWPKEQNNNIVGGHSKQFSTPQYAFTPWRRWGGGQYNRYVDPVDAGAYSDDTQMTMAVARSILRGDEWFVSLTRTELPALQVYARGAGRALLAATRTWSRGVAPWAPGNTKADNRRRFNYFQAGANGVAMRIVPHVVRTLERPAADLNRRIVLDGVATHGHLRALLGAVVFGGAVRLMLQQRGTLAYGALIHALHDDTSWVDPDLIDSAGPEWVRSYRSETGTDPKDDWAKTAAETRQLLAIAADGIEQAALADDHAVLNHLGCFDRKRNGAGTITAVAAIYLASRHALDPRAGLLAAAFLDHADTDTLASMTAALLGGLHGTGWLRPLGDTVQDADYLRQLAHQLVSGRPTNAPATAAVTQHDVDRFDTALGEAFVNGLKSVELFERETLANRRFVDGRPVNTGKPELLDTRGGPVVRWHLQFEGQTAVADVIVKGADRAIVERYSASGSEHRPARRTSEPSAPVDASDGGSAVVDAVALGVTSLERSTRFYRDAIGLPVTALSADVVALTEQVHIRTVRTPNRFAEPAVMLTVRARDVLGVVKAAVAAGGEVIGEASAELARLRDPDGHEIRLVHKT